MSGRTSENPLLASSRNGVSAPPAGRRRSFAIVCNSYAPYRVHFHTRLTREIPELTFYSLSTHHQPGVPWLMQLPQEMQHIEFGAQENVDRQSDAGRALHEWRKGGRICRWLAEHHVDLVMVNGYADLGRLRIIRWCRRRGVPVFLQGDSNIADDTAVGMKRRIKLALVTRFLSWCDGALACGSRGRAYFRRYGVPDERIHIVTLEPDYAELMAVTAVETAAMLARLNLAVGRRRLIYSGRLIPIKRIDLAIDAFGKIAGARPEWDLVIAGDGALRASLAARVPEPLRERIVWTGFIAQQRQLSALYRGCDALVLPSDREAWALVINEAAAAGLAIVSSTVPGAAAELVRDGVNGRIFPAGNVEALAAALLDVTRADRIDEMKAASPGVLAAWRAAADPVRNTRRLLAAYGLLPAAGGTQVETTPLPAGVAR